ncbi:FMN-binding protein [Dactylosporangium sp. AC04546]|uniref:FMN-binding protein n=1 Tax=Dactylosporangium sp. AC04546 TaxID=2862460 RepID=UPI001EDCE250|nr:FMN-binding protein [Dactylosporangium sp. AC04546]WVK84947.1 FMN-binding protein [Dactylosporangium sp. AC04546]
MRRAMIALMGTAAGTILLVGAKAGFSSPSDQAMQPAAGEPKPGAVPSGSVAAPPQPGASAAPGSAAPGTIATTTAAAPGKTTAPGQPKPTTAAPKPPRTTMKDGTFKGNAVYVDYGNVELSIVVSGGKITDIKVLDSPSDHSRSVQINNSALPKLKSEALAAQSADIDSVSGATYTSSGYKLSLQSAIDRAYQA